jgi:hypothetical protein
LERLAREREREREILRKGDRMKEESLGEHWRERVCVWMKKERATEYQESGRKEETSRNKRRRRRRRRRRTLELTAVEKEKELNQPQEHTTHERTPTS